MKDTFFIFTRALMFFVAVPEHFINLYSHSNNTV